MGSIFSSKHSFSSVATPVKEAARMGKILKARKRALDVKTQRKINAKRRKKERIYKREERAEKHSQKMEAKAYDRGTKILLKKLEHEYKKEMKVQKPKYNKWGDRIA